MKTNRKVFAVVGLLLGVAAFAITFALAASGMIDDFAYQVRRFSVKHDNLFEFAITILVTVVLIGLPLVLGLKSMSNLRKLRLDPSNTSGKGVWLASMIVNFLAAALYLVFALVAYGAGPRLV